MRTALIGGIVAALVAASPAAAALPTSERGCPDWPEYGRTHARTFSYDCPGSRITRGSVSGLRTAWSFKTARAVTATPAVVDGVVYVGDWSGTMYALRDGMRVWAFKAAAAPAAAFGPIVSSAAIADVRGRRLVIFGAGPRVYALDARDGRQAWVYDRSRGKADTTTEFESSPLVYRGSVYIGVDTHSQDVQATSGIRGGLMVLNAATGKRRWNFSPELGNPGKGCGGVWSSPTLDKQRDLVYIATANCTADTAWTPHTEAITALDATPPRGRARVVWTFQPHAPNRRDWDFGATPNLFTSARGVPTLGVGNKDGTYYALDPATGRRRWATRAAAPGDVSEDFSIGGFLGSSAVHGGRVFGATAIGGPPYFHAIDGAGGGVVWSGLAGPGYGATAVVNGVVFHAALDTLLRAYDATDGRLLWAAPMLAPVASGPVISGDTVVIGSGLSSSDLCVKGTPIDALCTSAFDNVLGALGGVTAFRLPA